MRTPGDQTRQNTSGAMEALVHLFQPEDLDSALSGVFFTKAPLWLAALSQSKTVNFGDMQSGWRVTTLVR